MAKKTQKTHKGVKKTMKLRPGGTVSRGKSGFRHNTGKKTASQKRQNRLGETLSKPDLKRLKDILK